VDNSTPAAINDAVNFTLVVTNNGPDAATAVALTDVIPADLDFVSASSTVGSYDSSTHIWTIGTLANGDAATLVIAAKVNSNSGGTVTNTATVASAVNDNNSANNTSSASVTLPGGGNGGGGCNGGCGGGFTPPPPSGGGGPSSGPSSGPTPQVLGANTGTGSLPMPQVLGASTSLPRTGVDLTFMILAFLAGLAIADRKFRLI